MENQTCKYIYIYFYLIKNIRLKECMIIVAIVYYWRVFIQHFKKSFFVFMNKGDIKTTLISKNIYKFYLDFIGLQIVCTVFLIFTCIYWGP